MKVDNNISVINGQSPNAQHNAGAKLNLYRITGVIMLTRQIDCKANIFAKGNSNVEH